MTRIGVASPAVVKMTVDPTPVTAAAGTTVTIAIKVVDAPYGTWGVYSWMAKLQWHNTTMDYVSSSEGPFLKQWALSLGTDTFWVDPIFGYSPTGDTEHVYLSCSMMGSYNGRGGSGHLAYVTFNVLSTTPNPIPFLNPGAEPGKDTVLVNRYGAYLGSPASGVTFTAVDGAYVAKKVQDIFYDGDIDILDLTMVAIKYLQTGSAGWIPEDVVQDGIIDIADLASVAYQYGWYAGTKPIDC